MAAPGYPGVVQRLHQSFEASTAQLGAVRSTLRSLLLEVGEPHTDWVLIATELATNAIEAGTGDRFDVEIVVSDDTVELTVINQGLGFSPGAPTSVAAHQHHGRGLLIVRELVDEFDVSIVDGRTIVRCLRCRDTHRRLIDLRKNS